MKTLLALALLAALPCSADILGFNDNCNRCSGNDHDFNDAEFVTLGLSFHTYAPFAFVAPPGYTEFPFPTPAQYFDYAISDGSPLSILYAGGQTSGRDVLEVSNDGWLTWASVGNGLTATEVAGTRIDFRLNVNDGDSLLYADPSWDIDHMGSGVVYTPALPPPPPGSEVPEPGSLALGATGLLLVGIARLRK